MLLFRILHHPFHTYTVRITPYTRSVLGWRRWEGFVLHLVWFLYCISLLSAIKSSAMEWAREETAIWCRNVDAKITIVWKVRVDLHKYARKYAHQHTNTNTNRHILHENTLDTLQRYAKIRLRRKLLLLAAVAIMQTQNVTRCIVGGYHQNSHFECVCVCVSVCVMIVYVCIIRRHAATKKKYTISNPLTTSMYKSKSTRYFMWSLANNRWWKCPSKEPCPNFTGR